MDIAKFVAEIEDALNSPRGTIGDRDCLENLDGLDSMGILAIIATAHARYRVTLHAIATGQAF
jgi:hypothetical protein